MKAKHFFLRSLLLLVMAQTVVSCIYTSHSWSDGPRVVEPRALKGFDKIEVLGSPSVHYFQADTYHVSVEGPEDAVKKIITSVEDGTLTIRNKGKIGMLNVSLGDMGDVSVHVGSPDLTSVCLSGSGDFVCESDLDTDHMRISLRGSGDITVHFGKGCQRVDCQLNGSGDICLEGEVEQMNKHKTGSGDIDTDKLVIRH